MSGSPATYASATPDRLLPRALTIALVLAANLIGVNASIAAEETPGIYMVRINDRSGIVVPGLKAQYKICADSRQLYKRLSEQGGAGWDAVKTSLPKAYDVRAVTEPEPDWKREKVGQQIEKEYFFREKYARYQYRNRYEISEAERCALIRHEDLVIDLDDGRSRYLITLKDRIVANATPGNGRKSLALQYRSHKVSRMPSQLKIRERNDQALQAISKQERIARLLSLLFADTKSNRVPGVGLSYDPALTGNIETAVGYAESNFTPVVIPRQNDEHFVAGQPCDIIAAKDLRSRLWYWDVMHHYPGALERPVLLKTEVVDPNHKVVSTEEATEFHVLSEIDDSVFELDASLK